MLCAMRFRVTGPVEGVRFADGGKKLLVRVWKGPSGVHGDPSIFRFFEAEKGLSLGQSELLVNRILSHGTSSGPVKEFLQFSTACMAVDASMIATTDRWPSALQVREAATSKVLLEIKDDRLDFRFVQFSPDGKHVAAVVIPQREAKDQGQPTVTIRLLNLGTGKEVRAFVAPPQPNKTFQPHWFTFSPDGAYLAASGYEEEKAGIVRVWEVAGNKPSWRLEGQTASRDEARAIAFAPDGKSLAAVHDGKLRLWESATGKQVKAVADYAGRCVALDFSPDGTHLIAVDATAEQVRLWNLNGGGEIPLPVKTVFGYVFSQDGQTLVLADATDGGLLVCDGLTGKLLHKAFAGYQRPIRHRLEELFTWLARAWVGHLLSPLTAKLSSRATAPGRYGASTLPRARRFRLPV
jgi:hypothetical protein